MNHLRHQNYENKKINNTQKSRSLKVTNSLLQAKKYFKPVTVSISYCKNQVTYEYKNKHN